MVDLAVEGDNTSEKPQTLFLTADLLLRSCWVWRHSRVTICPRLWWMSATLGLMLGDIAKYGGLLVSSTYFRLLLISSPHCSNICIQARYYVNIETKLVRCLDSTQPAARPAVQSTLGILW